MEVTVKIKEEPLCPEEPTETPSDEMFQGNDDVNNQNIKTEQPIATVLITEFKGESEENVGKVLKEERENEEDQPSGTPLSQDQISPLGNTEIGKIQKERDQNLTKNNHRVVVWIICHKEDFMEQTSAQNSDICGEGAEKNPTDEDGNCQESAISTVSCGICNKILENVSDLHKHIKIQHDDQHSASPNSNSVRTLQPVHRCGICFREFKKFGSLYQHAKVHAEHRLYLCKKCGRKFSERSLLQKHEGIHTKDRRFLCSTCGKTFFGIHALKMHMITHLSDGNHACNVCSKSFASYSNFRVHLLSHMKPQLKMHLSDGNHACDVCSKSFASFSHLRAHLLSHTGVKTLALEGNLSNVDSETIYSCNVCGESLT